jgi:hypothetical protein
MMVNLDIYFTILPVGPALPLSSVLLFPEECFQIFVHCFNPLIRYKIALL